MERNKENTFENIYDWNNLAAELLLRAESMTGHLSGQEKENEVNRIVDTMLEQLGSPEQHMETRELIQEEMGSPEEDWGSVAEKILSEAMKFPAGEKRAQAVKKMAREIGIELDEQDLADFSIQVMTESMPPDIQQIIEDAVGPEVSVKGKKVKAPKIKYIKEKIVKVKDKSAMDPELRKYLMRIGIPVAIGIGVLAYNAEKIQDAFRQKTEQQAMDPESMEAAREYFLNLPFVKGKTVMILNKQKAEVETYDGNGRFVRADNVGIGTEVGDENDGHKTGAGAYTLSTIRNEHETAEEYGKDLFRIFGYDLKPLPGQENKLAYRMSIHSIYKTEQERREKAMMSKDPKDRRVSWGCTNMFDDQIQYIWDQYRGMGSMLFFIMPEDGKFKKADWGKINSEKNMAGFVRDLDAEREKFLAQKGKVSIDK